MCSILSVIDLLVATESPLPKVEFPVYRRLSPKMYSLYQYLVLLSPLVSQLTSAATLGRQANSDSFRVDQVARTRPAARNGLAAYAKVLRKYAHHANNTDDVISQAAALVDASSVVTTPVGGDELYITPVTIGDQTFELDIDTGSSDL